MKIKLFAIWLIFLPHISWSQTAPSQPAGCTSEQSRQFDFWVGSWEVFAANNLETKVADSLIERLYGGCAIRENWMPLRGGSGGSLNAYISSTQKWRQTWADSSGSFVDFEGSFMNGKMVLQGVWPQPGHPNQLTRMTYSRLENGWVRQRGESSDDNGTTWVMSFVFIYKPKPEVQ